MQAIRKSVAATVRASGPGQNSTTTSTGTMPMRSRLSRFGSATVRPEPGRAAASATGLADTRALPEIAEPVAEHAGQVLAGLGDVRDPAHLVDPHGSRGVGGHREREIAVVSIEQAAKILDASFDVVLRRERVLHPDLRRGIRHQLHESLRSLWRDSQVIEARLGLDHRLLQRILHAVAVSNHA